ncbi:acyltransferase family protein [Mucilaginibacter sp. SP1R1]|uniref:acyltransferase family protein n=1 Tax=Mucilaginibacter sp. SP1R1 TaxID=2723091 RepID=UPI001616D2B3|nr:acyltransferase [Mucilaginibacter sp. SP1R1]MBB6148310.1 fucose 4-O-acetylase-like acetyltransferase [Mucilaginibacter sp. SP1R1]
MNILNAKHILSKKRYIWVDSDKGISILLVGFGHCLLVLRAHGLDLNAYPLINYISLFLYGFRMPLFFIISGIFIASSLKKKGLNEYITNRADTILYPLLLWGGIEISLQLLTARYSANGITPMNYLNLLIDPRKTGHFWYLNTLFCIGVIYACLQAALKVKPVIQVVIGAVLYAIAAYLHINEIQGGFLTDICEFYLFFALGDFISNTLLDEKNAQRFSSFKVFIPLLLVFLFIQYHFARINLHGGADGINFVERKMPFFFLLEALVGCTISINFSFLLQKYQALNFLRVIGFHSLFIYCMQIIVMTITRVILVNLFHFTYIPGLVAALWICGTLLPMLFYNLCMRLDIWWLFTFRKPDQHRPFIPKEKNIPETIS